jgi:hypothetical protein
MREIKFRAWNGKHMDYDYRDASLWNGLLVAEGDTILMQFIGLTDETNKEIYEGDIIKYEFDGGDNIERPPRIDEVKYVLGCFIPDIWRYQKPEVIGNIYENPELLKVN